MGKNKKSNFDGIVSFDMPVHIKNDKEEEISIYGLLFNKKERHGEALYLLGPFLSVQPTHRPKEDL